VCGKHNLKVSRLPMPRGFSAPSSFPQLTFDIPGRGFVQVVRWWFVRRSFSDSERAVEVRDPNRAFKFLPRGPEFVTSS
jgi:hypothetical protein